MGLTWITPDQLKVTDGGNGHPVVEHGGEALPDVRFVQLFPLRQPDAYISVVQPRSGERAVRELGTIRKLADWPAAQQKAIRSALRQTYFLPEISVIHKINVTGGIDEWVVQTDRGEKTLYVCDRKQSLHICHDGMLLITDMDKCRYRIQKPQSLDANSRFMLDKAMY